MWLFHLNVKSAIGKKGQYNRSYTRIDVYVKMTMAPAATKTLNYRSKKKNEQIERGEEMKTKCASIIFLFVRR